MFKKFLMIFGVLGLLGVSAFGAGEAPAAVGSYLDMLNGIMTDKIKVIMVVSIIFITGWMYLQTTKKFYLLAGVIAATYVSLAANFTTHLTDWSGTFIQ
jgi:hypothetical protein